jgi:hypothetical protein
MSEKEIKVAQEDRDFIIKITNRKIVSYFLGVGIAVITFIATSSYWFGGFVTKVDGYEPRIKTLETFKESSQDIINRERAKYNESIRLKTSEIVNK